jgi:hypothetical protein
MDKLLSADYKSLTKCFGQDQNMKGLLIAAPAITVAHPFRVAVPFYLEFIVDLFNRGDLLAV